MPTELVNVYGYVHSMLHAAAHSCAPSSGQVGYTRGARNCNYGMCSTIHSSGSREMALGTLSDKKANVAPFIGNISWPAGLAVTYIYLHERIFQSVFNS